LNDISVVGKMRARRKIAEIPIHQFLMYPVPAFYLFLATSFHFQ
jgi:hypothetical protein